MYCKKKLEISGNEYSGKGSNGSAESLFKSDNKFLVKLDFVLVNFPVVNTGEFFRFQNLQEMSFWSSLSIDSQPPSSSWQQ